MNSKNVSILNKLTFSEYKEFVRNLIGFSCFINDIECCVCSVRSRKGKTGIVATSVVEGREKEYYVTKEEHSKRTFKDNEGRVKNIADFDFIGEDVLHLLLLASKKSIDLEDIVTTYDNDSFIKQVGFGDNGVSGNKNFGFIIGAGINTNLGPQSWTCLINDIKSIITTQGNVSSDGMKALEQFSYMNYFVPQVAKSISENDYYWTIFQCLYSNVNWNNLKICNNPQLVNTNLYQVARIVSDQTANNQEQRILTFNYDNLLERVLLENFNQTCFSEYNNFPCKNPQSIKVVHSHGFLPYNDANTIPDKKQKNSIVFSSFEYMEQYMNKKRYGYKNLEEQLKQTNLIIGNSIADYEEQKVMYTYHRNHMNGFQYMITAESGDHWVDYYKSVFLFRMGVIVLYFPDWDKANDFLKSIKPYKTVI